MRLLQSNPFGKVVINPPDLRAFVDNSPERAAGIVLHGRDIVVSTDRTDHCSMMDMAGIEQKMFAIDATATGDCGCPIYRDPATATLRGGTGNGHFSVDVWHRGDTDRIPFCIESIEELFAYLKSHRKLAKMDEIEIIIYNDDYVPVYSFDASGLHPHPVNLPQPRAMTR